MTIDISILCRQIDPEKTVLILGAGATIPSGAPSANDLRDELGKFFDIESYSRFDLMDLATIIESKWSRRDLVDAIRKRLLDLQPTGGILNIPLFKWAGIFTTNYDDLVEKCFKRSRKDLQIYSSNYDFCDTGLKDHQELFKFHGTIDKDVCDGHKSRMIITTSDYDEVSAYRDLLYSRMRDLLFSKSVLIIGHSLSDPDLRTLVNEAQKQKTTYGAPGKLFLFIYEKNDDYSLIFESRGLSVCFGGIDEFFNHILRQTPSQQHVLSVTTDVLDRAPILATCTLKVPTEMANQLGQLDRMFSGRPASYADIAREWTFDRDIANQIEAQISADDGKPIAIVLGAAGVGKTTAIRIALSRLSSRGFECWEHKTDFNLEAEEWHKISKELIKRKATGVLFIDESHQFMRDINKLVELLSSNDFFGLKLVLVSSRPHWNPRSKTAEIFRNCEEYSMSQLSLAELNGLLDLLDSSREIRALVESSFLGFSRPQRFERLKERCSADMFVCMKNIFGYQSIDAIILNEFSSLDADLQDIYRIVAGMQAIGTKVHRELVRRLTGLEAKKISGVLDDLHGILEEYTVSERDGIYGWKVRHPLIASTIAKYKYSEQEQIYDLFEKVIETINPTYKFEVQSLNDMCDLDTGITRIIDRGKQNVLLRKMISMAPLLRVPRHRLIHNLISICEFDVAESEIRIFEKDLRVDGPVLRYKIRLKLGLAKHTLGIQEEDRAAIVREAVSMAQKCVAQYPDDKNMYRAYLEVGVDLFRYTKNAEIFSEAMRMALEAQERLLDPDLRSLISKYAKTGEEMGVGIF